MLLAGGLAATGAAAAAGLGLAIGYRKHEALERLSRSVRGMDPEPGTTKLQRKFVEDAVAIRRAQARQSLETVRLLKAKYESKPLFGRVRVWDMIEKLGQCIDPSDESLYLASQYTHVQQILAGMERDGVQDPDLYLTALLHDVGKVMLLTAEAPEHIVGYIEPMEKYSEGIGLDQVVFQFGHDEMIYQRLKGYVPERVAWSIRYHSARPDSIAPYLNREEKRIEAELLAKFRIYDQTTKSVHRLPRVEMGKYRDMIEKLFPSPILV
jgi:hypothetical protein